MGVYKRFFKNINFLYGCISDYYEFHIPRFCLFLANLSEKFGKLG